MIEFTRIEKGWMERWDKDSQCWIPAFKLTKTQMTDWQDTYLSVSQLAARVQREALNNQSLTIKP